MQFIPVMVKLNFLCFFIFCGNKLLNEECNYFLKEKNNIFIQQGHIKLIKYDSKNIYNVTKDFYFK